MRTDLFPVIEPFAFGMLDVDPPHRLYWEQCGNRSGVPVLFLHGGPGSGCTPTHRRFFDPGYYRIVLFDQRGAGRSIPLAETNGNTTQELIADIECLRMRLGIERWLVFGGSWGSTLALAYGEAHPQRCLGFILRGIFLARPSEIDWFLHGIRTVFPEAWHNFAHYLPEAERDDLLGNYYRRLIDPDPNLHGPAARSWARYESLCSALRQSPDLAVVETGNDLGTVALARIEAHYMVNAMFLNPNQLLDQISRLHGLPATIVQGRYDMVCPIVTADTLRRAWPQAHYVVVPDAGHSALEPGMRVQLLAATERMKRRLSPRAGLASGTGAIP